MTDKEALQAVARGEPLPQEIIRRLWWEGLIEVEDVTKPDSPAPEYRPKFITPKGRRSLGDWTTSLRVASLAYIPPSDGYLPVFVSNSVQCFALAMRTIQTGKRRTPMASGNLKDNRKADLELVARARQGDSEAFGTLFYSHKARVYAVCLRMTNNTAQAEDLTQEAFLQVFRKLSTFKGNSALSTWLHRIAVNTVLMHFRKKALKQVSLDERSSVDATMVRREYGSRDRRLAGVVDRITLNRAIRELSPGYRTIFMMHEVKGYEHQEIARLLDCSVGNSKSQLHKAKGRIRAFLGEADSRSLFSVAG